MCSNVSIHCSSGYHCQVFDLSNNLTMHGPLGFWKGQEDPDDKLIRFVFEQDTKDIEILLSQLRQLFQGIV